jgi:predicted amino acid-binding ACT domain protein
MTSTTRKYSISLMAEDRPGIVAAVSGSILDLQGNIIAISQTVVNGYFTIILVTEFPESVSPELLQQKLIDSGRAGEYSVMVRNYVEPHLAASLQSGSSQYVLTATGPDTSGIIHLISINLARRGVNILDISGHREYDQLILVAQLDVPQDVDILCLQDELAALGMKKNISIHLQHINIFKETNRI